MLTATGVIVFYCILLYILVMIGVAVWDAFIGLGYNFLGNSYYDYDRIVSVETDSPVPLAVVLIFWPVTIIVLTVLLLIRTLKSVKGKRLEKEKEQHRLRIAAQKEYDSYLEEVNEALVTEQVSHTLKVK